MISYYQWCCVSQTERRNSPASPSPLHTHLPLPTQPKTPNHGPQEPQPAIISSSVMQSRPGKGQGIDLIWGPAQNLIHMGQWSPAFLKHIYLTYHRLMRDKIMGCSLSPSTVIMKPTFEIVCKIPKIFVKLHIIYSIRARWFTVDVTLTPHLPAQSLRLWQFRHLTKQQPHPNS